MNPDEWWGGADDDDEGEEEGEREGRQCGEEEKESFCLVKFCVNVEGWFFISDVVNRDFVSGRMELKPLMLR